MDARRVAERLEALWTIRLGPGGGADRPAYSPAEAEAMRLVAGWATEAGLRPALDPHGDLWGLPGDDHGGPLVTSGSHVDSVPDGGRYDGALGTVLALEAAEAVRTSDGAGASFALLVCAAEEAPRFSAGTVGSRLLVGTLPESELAAARDAEGVPAAAARDAFLAELADLPRLPDPPLARVRAHLEVHVEQRAGLHPQRARLGVVEHVAAPHRHTLVVEGEAGHAGEVAMHERRDALCAAAELVLALEAAARERPEGVVATVGRLTVEPGAVSTIPATVTLGLEVRAFDAGAIAAVEADLERAAQRVAATRGVRIQRTAGRRGDPVALDPGLVEATLAAACARGVPAVRARSGAGHDAAHLAGAVPSGLLLVPLVGGESHTPHETVALDEAVLAGEVLIDVLSRAAGPQSGAGASEPGGSVARPPMGQHSVDPIDPPTPKGSPS